ncbi:hypothetical protein Goshw_003926 [Gossypium schwendimanii]|uniref:Uncharacterized protein n=1 Tax=Gossypium schwendimanii TaxID=34291 RepID=A0A7J9MFG6_GOSSC|nr:hypothetical protein [Gossypium schwendimanii]
MDEIGLFYRLQADHSLATKQLEGLKKEKERLTAVVAMGMILFASLIVE